MKTANKFRLILILLLAIPLSLQARKSDFAQAIDVQADSSEFDEKSGLQILRGNVEISQGSMKIQADEITVDLQLGKLSLIRGKGSPIIFQQENEDGELVVGRCEEIEYDAAKATLKLSGNASLTQPNQELSGDVILFESKTQKVLAEGGKDRRVNIKIQPPPEQQSQ